MHDKNLLDEFLKGAYTFKEKTIKLSEELLDYYPDIENAWSIREHIVHIVDSEINNFIRIKSAIAQPDSNCYVINEEQWVKNLRGKKENIEKYVSVFVLLREILHEFINDIPGEDWDSRYYIRNNNGEKDRITIEKGIEIYKNHVFSHINFIDRNIEAFMNR